MNKLIILEGPDGVGKSSFAEALSYQGDSLMLHSGSEVVGREKDHYKFMMKNLELNFKNTNIGKTIILDRFWPSDICYAKALREIQYESVVAARTDKFLNNLSKLHEDTGVSIEFVFVMCKGGVVPALEKHKLHLDKEHPYTDEEYLNIYSEYEFMIRYIISKVCLFPIKGVQVKVILTDPIATEDEIYQQQQKLIKSIFPKKEIFPIPEGTLDALG